MGRDYDPYNDAGANAASAAAKARDLESRVKGLEEQVDHLRKIVERLETRARVELTFIEKS
jgi:uncharacterized protein YceH (UPF0502 family)